MQFNKKDNKSSVMGLTKTIYHKDLDDQTFNGTTYDITTKENTLNKDNVTEDTTNITKKKLTEDKTDIDAQILEYTLARLTLLYETVPSCDEIGKNHNWVLVTEDLGMACHTCGVYQMKIITEGI